MTVNIAESNVASRWQDGE